MLNLTPFLTHNLNLLNNPNSAGNLSNNVNYTPFYDKSLHLTDFFIDSPLRPSPSRAVETITPSRFAMHPEKKNSDTILEPAMSLKRSITQLDTPARHPFKKNDSQLGNDKNDSLESDYENENYDPNNDHEKSFEENFVTPSKKNVLKDTSRNLLNKSPIGSTPKNPNSRKNLYQTPAKLVVQMSSPSTVIVSSAVKSPEDEEKKEVVPPSPTPKKERSDVETSTDLVSEPVMGIFSERKAKSKNDLPPKQNTQAKKTNKKQQSGTNRFQIVFTDVHTLMNSKKKKEGELEKKGDKKKPQRKVSAQKASQEPSFSQVPQFNIQTSDNVHQRRHNSQHPLHRQQPQQAPPAFAFHHSSSSLSASQDYNTTMNSSKEFSMVGNNSTMNTTNPALNFSQNEHSSFEVVNPGMVSTPNRKYLLDNSFDKASPQAINQMTSSFNHFNVRQLDGLRHDDPNVFHRDMPPPKSMMLPHGVQHAPRPTDLQQNAPGMNMMMSTPQHASVSNQNFFLGDESSPSNKETWSMLYHQLHRFEQTGQEEAANEDQGNTSALLHKSSKGYQ